MKRLLSIFLSILMLTGSTGITMATHFCGGEAMETQLMYGHAALGCGMNDMEKECERQKDSSEHLLKTENCCANHYTTIESDDTITSKQVFQTINLKFFVAFAFTYLGLQPSEVDNNSQYTNYSPPLLKQDIPILHQSFLL